MESNYVEEGKGSRWGLRPEEAIVSPAVIYPWEGWGSPAGFATPIHLRWTMFRRELKRGRGPA